MTTLREAAQQVLEALDCPGKAKTADEQDAITALRAALAQQAEPVEPVAYRHLHEDGWEYHDAPTGEDCAECQALYTAPPQQAEPVAWMVGSFLYGHYDCIPSHLLPPAQQPLPLFTAPPQRKPLTEEEIIDIGKEARAVEGPHILPVTFARAIERAHGIK